MGLITHLIANVKTRLWETKSFTEIAFRGSFYMNSCLVKLHLRGHQGIEPHCSTLWLWVLLKGMLLGDCWLRNHSTYRLAYKKGATETKRQHAFFEVVNWALIRCATPPEIPKPVDFECIPAPPASSTEKNIGTVAAAPDQKTFW